MKQFKIYAKDDVATIYVYEEIGEWGVTGKAFAEQMQGLAKAQRINVRINSPGGDVFDGLAMFNLLNRHGGEVTVDVDGWAASAASVVAMAGRPLNMAANSFLLIHPPWTVAGGNAGDFRRAADQLEAVGDKLVSTYAESRGVDRDTVADWVASETMFSADEAVAAGMADAVTGESAIAAKADFSECRYVPDSVKRVTGKRENWQDFAAAHRQRQIQLARGM